MENKEVFISYKSEEFDDALWVKNQLEANGISCWMAPMCITGGASYATEIPIAIQQCKAFVLILSAGAQESKWIPRELDQAINADKVIMPFMIKDCTLNEEFSFYLGNVQRYPAFIDRDESMKKMIAEIRNYLGKKAPVEEKVEKSEEPAAEKVEKKEEPIAPKTEAPEPVAKPAKTKKLEPSPKTKQQREAKANKKKKVALPILIAVVAIAVIFGGSIFGLVKIFKGAEVVVADTTFYKKDYRVTLEDKTITEEDLNQLLEFEDLSFVYFTNCTFETNKLDALGALDLNTLDLSGCGLTDTQLKSIDFNAYEDLQALNLEGNDKLTDLSVISPVADTVTELNVSNIAISDFTWLKGFTKITAIYIDNTGATNLDSLLDMAYLSIVSARDNQLTDLNGLVNACVLRQVDVAGNQLTDISALGSSASKLQEIVLDNNALEDVSVLADCVELSKVSINNNKLNSVSWTKNLSNLTDLYLSENSLVNLDGITQSNKLVALDVSKNMLTEVKGLVFSADNYITADFSNNQITSATLPTDCKYERLLLNKNPLQDGAFLTDTNGILIAFEFFDALDAELLTNSFFSKIYIADCPTNRLVEIEESNYAIQVVSSEELEELLIEN